MPKIRVLRSSDRIDRPTGDFDAYPQPGVIAADASGASPLFVTLPAATSMRAGEITIVNTGATGTVIVDTTGADTINGSATYTLTSQYDAVTVESLGGSPGWVIATGGGGGGGGVTDHGALTGLADDDHLQYQRADSVFTSTDPFTITDESLVVTTGAAVTLPDAASNAGRMLSVGAAGQFVTISPAGTDILHGVSGDYILPIGSGVSLISANIGGWGWAINNEQGAVANLPTWYDVTTGLSLGDEGNVLRLEPTGGGLIIPTWTNGPRAAEEFLSGTGWTDDVPVLIPVKNTTASTIAKGAPVYATGTVGATSTIEIAPTDADNAATMPAIGLTNSSLAVNATGYVTVVGTIRGVNTAAYAINQPLYVSTTAGQLTDIKPTGASELIQNVGRVTRVNSSTGEILVLGAGRTNDVPNAIDAGKLTSGTVASARLNTKVLGGQDEGTTTSATTDTSLLDSTVTVTGAAGDLIDVVASIRYLNNTGASKAPTIKLKLGATTVITWAPSAIATSATPREFSFRASIRLESTTDQNIVATPCTHTAAVTLSGTSTENLGTGVALDLTGANADAVATQEIQLRQITITRIAL